MIEDFQLLTSGVLESSTGSFSFILSRAKSTSKEELSKCSVVKRITSSCIPLTKPSYMVSTFNCWREDMLSSRLPRKQQRDWIKKAFMAKLSQCLYKEDSSAQPASEPPSGCPPCRLSAHSQEGEQTNRTLSFKGTCSGAEWLTSVLQTR